jgi:hypothetical protein
MRMWTGLPYDPNGAAVIIACRDATTRWKETRADECEPGNFSGYEDLTAKHPVVRLVA